MNTIYEHGEQSEVLRSQNIQQPNSLSVRQKQVTAKKCRKRRIAEIIDSDATAADLRDADAGDFFLFRRSLALTGLGRGLRGLGINDD